MSRLRNLLLAIASGLVLSAAFPGISWWWLSFIALAGLFVAIADASGRSAFGLGVAFGLAFFLPHLQWADFAVGLAPWVALSAAMAVYVGLACMCFAHASRAGFFDGHAWLTPWAFALLWTGAEVARSYFPFGGFPWGRLAFGVVDAPIVNLAYYGGAPLVSFVVAFAGAVLGLGVLALQDRRFVSALAAPLIVIVLVVAPLGVPLDPRAEAGTIAVGWVQGNVPNEGLDSFQQAHLVTQNHADATRLLAESHEAPLDLVIWPENASDLNPKHDATTFEIVTAAAQAVGVPLIIGTVDYTPENGRYNVSMVWLPEGIALGEYRKQRPAAFAEYIPIRDIARLFSPAVDRVTRDMIPGTEPAVLDVYVGAVKRNVRVGTIICFEVAYDDIDRESVREGAEFLAVQTNNATFGLTAESTQQLAMSRLRAIETGRATLQVSTVGVSGVIEPDGRVRDTSELFTQDYGVATVALRTSITPAVKYGDWIQWGLLGGGALLAISACVSRIRNEYEW